MSENKWIQKASELYDLLDATNRAFSAVSAQRVENLALLESARAEQDAQARKFWVAMHEQGLTNGANEDARKQARERAYEEHGDEAPYGLITRVKRIQHLEILCDGLEIEFKALAQKLNACAAQVELLKVLIEHAPTTDEAAVETGEAAR